MASVGETIARAVSAERVRRGWTQARLAQAAGMSPASISRLETGQRQVTANDLAPLCRALGVGLAELIARADPDDRDALRVL